MMKISPPQLLLYLNNNGFPGINGKLKKPMTLAVISIISHHYGIVGKQIKVGNP
jgi:hypothetical protein